MKLADYYIRLRQHTQAVGEHQPCTITVSTLMSIFGCTKRNVPLIMSRMQQREWVKWIPGRGRGRKSTIIFQTPINHIVLQIAKERIEQKDIQGALNWMESASLSDEDRQRFRSWLIDGFGHRFEVRDHKRIDTLRLPLGGPVHTFDPLRTNFAAESQLARQLYDTLVRYDARTGTIMPHVAHDWIVDASRTRWTFYLRKGVLFHNGREMTSEHIKMSLMRPKQMSERILYRWVHERIEQIDAVDPYVLAIRLKQPNELFSAFLSTHRASIIYIDNAYERDVDSADLAAPIGTGPFKLVHRDRNSIVLEAFPSYFKERAHLDRVELWNIPELYHLDQDQQQLPFHLIPNIAREKSDKSDWKHIDNEGGSCKFLTFNLLRGGLIHRMPMRKALSKLCDASRFADQPGLYPTRGFVDGDSVQKSPVQGSVKSLLHEAGYNGETIELCTIPHYKQDAIRIQSLCAEAGVHVRIKYLEPERFKTDERLDSDLILFTLTLDHEMELRLIDLYMSMQDHLPAHASLYVLRKIEIILSEPVRESRLQLLRDIEQYLQAEQLICFLYKKKWTTAIHRSLRGISDAAGHIRFSDLWLAIIDVCHDCDSSG